MKKIFLSLFLFAFGVSTTWAQLPEAQNTLPANQPPLQSKRGINILPEAGDWGLGIDTSPFFAYFSNFFRENSHVNSPWLTSIGNPTNNAALFGKYFINANTAYRASFNLGFGQNVRSGSVISDIPGIDPYNPIYTVDMQRTNYNNVALAFGLEKRRGQTRVQGIYGADAYLGYASNDIFYQYGNDMNPNFTTPSTYNFGNNTRAYYTPDFHRTIYENTGRRFSTGVRGFVGIEYFIAPKIAIGGEFGYNLGITYQSRPETRVEIWNYNIAASQEVQSLNHTFWPNSGTLSFGTGLNNLSSSINMHFYF
jgi:hypothetical protein